MLTRRNRHRGKWAGRVRASFWALLLLALLFFNVRLYAPYPLVKETDRVPPQLLAQLAANRSALDAGSASQMQEYFPEGYYFSYLFHGLTWVELAMRDATYSEQAIQEALDCLKELESREGRSPFPIGLPPDHGMFYSAWKCSLRGGIVVLQQGKDAEQVDKWRKECDAIAATIKDSKTRSCRHITDRRGRAIRYQPVSRCVSMMTR